MAAQRRRRIVRRRRKRKIPRVFTRSMRVTLFFLFLFFLFAFLGLIGVVCYWNFGYGEDFKKNVLAQQTYTNTVLNYQRGAIKDRNSTTLAVSVRKYNLILEPRTIHANEKLKEATFNAISTNFGIEISKLETVYSSKPDSMYEHFDELKEIESSKVDEFKKEIKNRKNDDDKNNDIIGVWFEETYSRNYPLKNIACNLVGFMSSENSGAYGVEESYNDKLCGVTGREYGYFDSNMNLKRTVKEAKDGNDIIMTIDANVQRIIEKQISNFQTKGIGAKGVAVMLMNPKNGEILAMASNNTFDLNNPRDLKAMYTEKQIAAMSDKEKNENMMKMWSNFGISSAYEPGSTFKPFTIAAALDVGATDDSATYSCGGVVNVAGTQIHCSNRNGHGVLSLRKSLMESCNSALMAIGADLGRENFYKYTKLYGFGQRTGVDLPGETSGLVHSLDTLNPVELATSSFGQTQTVTMVQMLSGFCSLVNGGNYYQPHIVKEIQNSNGQTVESINPVVVKKTVSEETSATLRSYLKSTVEEGTAAPAQVKGYSIGGKTGTAEKNGRNKTNYLVSFIGCVPAEDPDVAIYVIIDEPNVADQAHSTYATEFASKIMKKVLPFLGQYSSIVEKKKDNKQNTNNQSAQNTGAQNTNNQNTSAQNTSNQSTQNTNNQSTQNTSTQNTGAQNTNNQSANNASAQNTNNQSKQNTNN